jgi:hypothetical protein
MAKGMQELRCYAASGQLGYGVPKDSFNRGIKKMPHFIGADMGSIDVGPFYLGSGEMAPGKTSAKRDLGLLLRASRKLDIPLIIGSAGTAGGKPHLLDTVEMVREISTAQSLHFRLAAIHAEIDREFIKSELTKGPNPSYPPSTKSSEPIRTKKMGKPVSPQRGIIFSFESFM